MSTSLGIERQPHAAMTYLAVTVRGPVPPATVMRQHDDAASHVAAVTRDENEMLRSKSKRSANTLR